MLVERRDTAMGTSVHLAATDLDPRALDHALDLLADFDRRWTRFDPASELSRLNASNGLPCVVSPDTAALTNAAVDAWRTTAGRFDPSVHDAMLAAGYDRTFDDGPGPSGPTNRTPGLDDVQVDDVTGVVTLPADVRLDFGGIGKGFAADALAAELLDAGASRVAVSIGGDARVIGHGGDGWPMSVDGSDEPIAWVADGGFCFSSTARRRWTIDGVDHHHIIDPTTGASATGGIRHVAVAAANATLAEVHATAAVVSGWPTALDELQRAGLDGFIVTDAGDTHSFGEHLAKPRISTLGADGRRRE